MKILVMIKQVPDTATQVKIGSDPKAIDTTGITWIVSPYDEFAVEEGLRIKEKLGQGEVVAVSLGPDRVKEALRSCLAMGADRAIHLSDPAWGQADTLMTARALAAVIKQEAPGLALFGRQAIDDDMGAVGAAVAELLGWPCASWIMEESVDGSGKTVRMSLAPEAPALSVVKLEMLPPRPPGRIIPGEAAEAAKELVRALRQDAKAI